MREAATHSLWQAAVVEHSEDLDEVAGGREAIGVEAVATIRRCVGDRSPSLRRTPGDASRVSPTAGLTAGRTGNPDLELFVGRLPGPELLSRSQFRRWDACRCMEPLERLDDRDLLIAAATDAEAFGVFYRRHVNGVLRFFYRAVGRSDLAFDLTAETFAVSWLDSRGSSRRARLRWRGCTRRA